MRELRRCMIGLDGAREWKYFDCWYNRTEVKWRSFGIFIHGHLLQNDLLFTKVVTYEKKTCKKYVKQTGKSSRGGRTSFARWPSPKILASVLLFIYFEIKKSDDYGVGCNDNDGNGSRIQRISSNCNDDDGDEVIWWWGGAETKCSGVEAVMLQVIVTMTVTVMLTVTVIR